MLDLKRKETENRVSNSEYITEILKEKERHLTWQTERTIHENGNLEVEKKQNIVIAGHFSSVAIRSLKN